MPKRHYTISDFSGGMVTTQPGSDIQPNQYMFGYDIDPSYPGGLRGRKVDLEIKTSGISGTPLKAIRAELDIISQVLQTTSGVYQITDAVEAAPSPQALVSTSGAMQANNRAVHIGTGSGTAAKWFGMIPHTQFGAGAIATPQLYDSELAPPAFTAGKTFGTAFKGVNDYGTGLIYISSDRRSLIRMSTTDHLSTSPELFKNATAICNNGLVAGYVLVYDSGENKLYSIQVSNWSVHASIQITGLSNPQGDTIVSDMETTTNDIYFLVSTVDGALKRDTENNNNLNTSKNWLYKIQKTTTSDGNAINVTPSFGVEADLGLYAYNSQDGGKRIGLWEAEGIGGSIYGCEINLNVKARSLFRISSTQIGVYCGISFSGEMGWQNESLQVFSGPIQDIQVKVSEGVYHNIGPSLVIKVTGSSEGWGINSTNIVSYAQALPRQITFLSYSSSYFYRGWFNETGACYYDYSIKDLAVSDPHVANVSFGGTGTVSTALVKSAASVLYGGTWYHLNGDPTMEFVGRFGSGTSTQIVASLGTISLKTLENGFSEQDTRYYYRFSYLYDGFQESPLTNGEMSIVTGAGQRIEISVYIPASVNRRVSHINIYRSQSAGTAQSFYQLVETVSLAPSISSTTVSFGSTSITGRPFTYTDNYSLNQLGPTYESNSGLPETLSTSTVQYGLSAQINGYHFVADCSHSVIPNASQYIFRSVQGQFDNFNYLSNVLRLPERPIELATFRSRLYAFTKNRIWRIEPNGFYIEDEMEGYGIANKGAVVVTEFGMFFAGPNGIYYTDGSTPQDISFPINRNYSNETFGLLDPAYLNRTSDNVILNYDPRNRLVLVFYRPAASTSYRILAYSIDQRRWDHWDGTDFGATTGAPCSLSTGIPTMVSGTKVIAVAAGVTDKTVTYYGPWLDMEEPGTEKWFYQVKLQTRDNYPSSILVEIDDEGTVSLTANRVFEEGTSATVGKDAIYAYDIPKNGANYRAGKRIRLAFTAPTPCKIDSYSIIYRPKEFKGAK